MGRSVFRAKPRHTLASSVMCTDVSCRVGGYASRRHRTEHKDRMFNVSYCDPVVHKRCSFLQLTTTYCGMWAGLRSEVRCCKG